MALTTSRSLFIRLPRCRLVVLGGLIAILVCATTGNDSAAQEVLTNDTVLSMVRAGLPEPVIVQKIRVSQRQFDTSAESLIKLKGAGVPDGVIAAMIAEPGPPNVVATTPPEPVIAHLAAGDQRPLRSIIGTMQVKIEPFAGSRQEVVLPSPRAEYRITDKEPTFLSPQTTHQWILVQLKPGKKDRNLPINKNSGWWAYGGATFQQGADPKYVVKLATEPGPQGGIRLKPAEPLKPGEYGFVAATRGQVNLVEVFDFAVE